MNTEKIKDELREKFWLKANRNSCCADLEIEIDPQKSLALIVAEEEYSSPGRDYTQVKYFINLYDLKKDKVVWNKTSSYEDITGSSQYSKFSPEYDCKELYLVKQIMEKDVKQGQLSWITISEEKAKCKSTKDIDELILGF